MGDMKRILIVGGGYGGVWAGKLLERHFRRRKDVEITLVDMKPYHTLMTELHEIAGWRTDPDAVQVDFRKIFGARKVRVALDRITSIDFSSKVAHSSGSEYPFDEIILGVGAEPEYFGIQGIKENSFALWSFDDAMRIRHHLEHTFARAAAEADPTRRRSLLTFVVAGAGFTGIEMIGELLEYRDLMCRKHFLDRGECRVVVVEALPNVLPVFDDVLREKTEKYLRKMGCERLMNTLIVGAEPGKVLIKDGKPIETETFIWTCGVTGSTFGGSLGLPLGKNNRIETDDEMKSPAYPFVYAVGDNAWKIWEDRPIAQVVETAHFTAETAAKNIIADIDGGERHSFKPTYHGFMVSIGGRYGISNAGGLRMSGFFALAMKHLINIYYLFSIAGINQVWEYIKHEILEIRDARSLIGGFATHRTRAYWTVLLRLWLGFMWAVEGINKIAEGWLDFSNGQSKTGWMFSRGVVQAGVQTVDAASAASYPAAAPQVAPLVDATSAATAAAAAPQAAPLVDATSAATGATSLPPAVDAASAASAAYSADTTGGVAQAAAGAKQVAKAFIDMTAPVIDPTSGIVTWFRQTFMDGIFAHLPFQLMQVMIVAAELGIGLALMGGLFTWWAAVASIGLCLIFTLSGMFTWGQLWFFFAAIVMMGGAGRAFGLDYWSVPLFKRWWNGTKFARRSHLYADDPSK